MRGQLNDSIRWLIGLSIRFLGFGLTLKHRISLRTFAFNQRRLRKRYCVDAATPILKFGPDVEESISQKARRSGAGHTFAETSGTSDRPKRILFTNARLRRVKLAFIDMFARCCWHFSTSRTSLYVFSSFERDASLTSLLLNEFKLPSYFATLQAPYRLQCHPAVQSLVERYGATAVRLWILTIANPGVLYSTNPSTLSTFLEELDTNWTVSSRLINEWVTDANSFDPEIKWIAKRLDSRGSSSRLRRIAGSDLPLRLEDCAPEIRSYICWTGGYVKPFLDRIAQYLSPDSYRLIPMYSMSTETIETITDFRVDAVSFLPFASGVLYEFVELKDEDDPTNLMRPDQLEPGKHYSMVVSDVYGLRRYQTEDLFYCRGKVSGLPDLAFVGRRGIEYSFSGEKLTLDQASRVIRTLRTEYDWLATSFLTLVPSHGKESKPHYKLLLIDTLGARALPVIARRCDELLCETNCEYKSKRESGRLAAVQLQQVTIGDFLNNMSGAGAWEAQFKFLPFYRREWVAA